VGVVDPLGSYTGQGNPYGEDNRGNNVVFSAEPLVTVVPHQDSTAITGTGGKDVLKLTQNSSHLIITNNGVVTARRWDETGALQIQLGASADKLLTDGTVTVRLEASGGGGNDTLIGGEGNDELSGAGGKDRVYGQGGGDYLIGGGANDYLEGGDDNDSLSGGAGNDKLVGGAGPDHLIGGLGDDQFYVNDQTGDTISGNAGNDRADYDADDFRTSIEGVIS
jgi:Ca2+-binding RTX toxin-like protein